MSDPGRGRIIRAVERIPPGAGQRWAGVTTLPPGMNIRRVSTPTHSGVKCVPFHRLIQSPREQNPGR
jgi:hypothetical protein